MSTLHMFLSSKIAYFVAVSIVGCLNCERVWTTDSCITPPTS